MESIFKVPTLVVDMECFFGRKSLFDRNTLERSKFDLKVMYCLTIVFERKVLFVLYLFFCP